MTGRRKIGRSEAPERAGVSPATSNVDTPERAGVSPGARESK